LQIPGSAQELAGGRPKDKAWGKFQVCRQSNDKDPTSQPICFPVQTVEIIKTQYGDGDYEPKS